MWLRISHNHSSVKQLYNGLFPKNKEVVIKNNVQPMWLRISCSHSITQAKYMMVSFPKKERLRLKNHDNSQLIVEK